MAQERHCREVVRLVVGLLFVTYALFARAEPVAIEPRGRAPEPRGPAAPEPEPEPTAVEHEPLTAADVRDAPLPGFEHGRADPIDPGDSMTRRFGRSLLLIPRLSVEVLAQPVRGFLYLESRYNVIERVVSVFFTDDRRIGIFPTVRFDSGFGLNQGVQALLRDVFRKGERISLQAGVGGKYDRFAALDVGSGDLLPRPFTASFAVRYEERIKERFFGVGNADEIRPSMPIDPLIGDASASSRFEAKVWRVTPRLRAQLPRHFAATATLSLVRKTFAAADETASSDDIPIDQAFMTERITGFTTGTEFAYTEIELGWDTRHRKQWDVYGLHSAGSQLVAFAGRHNDLDRGPAFYRLGVDLQHHIRLTAGPRALELRAYGETVTGNRDEVPFSELPQLGGVDLLRGYDNDRFRDRVALLGQLAYRWQASRWLTPVIFTDAGRVYSGLDALTVEGLRVGYGGGFEVFSSSGLLIQGGLASSIDGGVNGFLSLSSAYDARPRLER